MRQGALSRLVECGGELAERRGGGGVPEAHPPLRLPIDRVAQVQRAGALEQPLQRAAAAARRAPVRCVSAGPAPPPVSCGARVRNSSSADDSCRSAENREGPPSQSSDSTPNRRRSSLSTRVSVSSCPASSTTSTCARQPFPDEGGGGEQRHAGLGLGEQREVVGQLAAAADDARQRLGRPPGGRPPLPTLGAGEDPPVALEREACWCRPARRRTAPAGHGTSLGRHRRRAGPSGRRSWRDRPPRRRS